MNRDIFVTTSIVVLCGTLLGSSVLHLVRAAQDTPVKPVTPTITNTFGLDVPKTFETNTEPRAIVQRVEGKFWTEWSLETNRVPPEIQIGTRRYASNVIARPFQSPPQMDLMRSYCPLQHIDTGVQEETFYVTSNLVSFLVWRGQTNRQYLESIPVTNIVRKWRWEAVKTYLP